MAQFESLPSELQIEIFNYLNNTDLKAARAVSKKCRDNATPALFRSIVACARYRAMGAFQNISLHSVYSKYVKAIIFDGSVYEALVAKSEHGYIVGQHTYPALKVNSYWMTRNRHKRYQTLYNEQEDMKNSEVLLHTIARALEWMPNVSSIVYSPNARPIPIERKDMRDLLPRSHTCDFTPWNHAFSYLIAAIFMSDYKGIRELRIEKSAEGVESTSFSLSMFDLPQEQAVLAARHLFQGLHKLELNMALFDGGSKSGIKEQLANLAKLLVAAKGLRHLAFHIPYWTPSTCVNYGHIWPHREPYFRSLGLGATWRELQSLSLEGIHADEQDFRDIIRRHKDTLRALAFQKCLLCTGIWAEIADEVVFSSSIVSFTINFVNETDDDPTESALAYKRAPKIWGYEGHLIISKDGERSFIDTNPDKESVYHQRSEGQSAI